MCAEVAEVSEPMLNLRQTQVELLRQNLEGLSKGQKVGENMDCPVVNGETRWVAHADHVVGLGCWEGI